MRAVIAEDSVLLREGLERLLSENGLDVVGSCETAEELLLKVRSYSPDVAIVDIRLPPTHNDEGLRAALEIRAAPSRGGRARAVAVRRAGAGDEAARRLGRGRGLPAQGPHQRRQGVHRRGAARRGRRLGDRPDHRLDPPVQAAERRSARRADAARARGARADGRGPLQPGDRGQARDHAPRRREVRLQHLRQARPARRAAATRAACWPCCSTCAPESRAAQTPETRPPKRQVSRLPPAARGCERGATPHGREESTDEDACDPGRAGRADAEDRPATAAEHRAGEPRRPDGALERAPPQEGDLRLARVRRRAVRVQHRLAHEEDRLRDVGPGRVRAGGHDPLRGLQAAGRRDASSSRATRSTADDPEFEAACSRVVDALAAPRRGHEGRVAARRGATAARSPQDERSALVELEIARPVRRRRRQDRPGRRTRSPRCRRRIPDLYVGSFGESTDKELAGVVPRRPEEGRALLGPADPGHPARSPSARSSRPASRCCSA